MTDEKKYDEETQKFYDEHRDMIEKILAQEKSSSEEYSEKAYLEEMMKRAAFERKIRMEYEAEKLRREAFDKSERAYHDYRYGRGRTEEAFDEMRGHMRDRFRSEEDYFFNMLMDESDHLRENLRRGRAYARDCFEEGRDLRREHRERARASFNELFDEYFGPFSEAQFQKHLFGAGLEFWMALNALIRSAPVPESIKNAFSEADENRNSEFCRKNQSCRAKADSDEDDAPRSSQQIKITPLKKEAE